MRRVAKQPGVRNYPKRNRALLRSAAFLFIIAIIAPVCRSQNAPPSFFVGGSLADNFALENIPAFDNGRDSCGVFKGGSGQRPNFFTGIKFPLNATWSLIPEISYNDFSSSSQIVAHETPLAPQGHNTVTGQDVQIDRTRNYDATIRQISLVPFISYSIFTRANFSMGPFFGYLISHSYSETEHITTPNVVYKENSLSYRTIGSSSLQAANQFQFGVALEASYELPIEPHLALRPSLNGIIPFTRIDPSLRTYSFNGSVALEYHFENLFAPQQTPPLAEAEHEIVAPQPVPKPAPSVPIIAPKKTMLQVSVKALGLEQNGKEVEEPIVSIERMHVTEVYPMLHYVFFEDGSADIPSRYVRSTPATRSKFDEKNLFTAGALEIHHHVLDILGRRLAEHPEASVTLLGTRSEHSEKDSIAGNTISLQRAKHVQDYLVTVWGISSARIHLRERSLPEAASDDHNSSGQAENRRVEIIPSSADITAPLWTERIERVATPPQIDFEPEITANAGIHSATISVFQHGKLLYQINALDSISNQYNWTIDERSMPDDAPNAEDSLRYVFTAIDSLGDTAEASGVIHLHKELRDTSRHAIDTSSGKQLDRYSLILFDYSSSSLDKKESEAIVHDMASAVGNGSSILLTGHTDKTGDDAFNDKLARDRVDRARDMLEAVLGKLHKSHEPIATESHGSRDNLFDNSIPEGRVLSRTVRATIEKGGE